MCSDTRPALPYCSIDEPFDLMTTKINATTSNFTFEPSSTGFNATATSLAALSTSDSAAPSLCADLDLSFVDDLGRDLQRIKSWGIGLLVVAMCVAPPPRLPFDTPLLTRRSSA
jgi:hypothetical protein